MVRETLDGVSIQVRRIVQTNDGGMQMAICENTALQRRFEECTGPDDEPIEQPRKTRPKNDGRMQKAISDDVDEFVRRLEMRMAGVRA